MNIAEITIRSIQHYMYCPHRWGLLEIDRAWAENAFVTKANLMHKRVHQPDNHYTAKGKQVFTSVPVYNDLDDYNLFGVVDCIELTEDECGICIDGLAGTYKLCIVEYKPTKPKNQLYHDEDLMQVFAQKLCVDYIFQCDSDVVIYYADVKKRIDIPIKESVDQLDEDIKRLLAEMRTHLDAGKIPPVRKGQKCSGCSMKDMCMPLMKRTKQLRSKIEEIESNDLEVTKNTLLRE